MGTPESEAHGSSKFQWLEAGAGFSGGTLVPTPHVGADLEEVRGTQHGPWSPVSTTASPSNPVSRCRGPGQLSPQLVAFWKFLSPPQHTHMHRHTQGHILRACSRVSKKSIIDFVFQNLYLFFD